jgi:NAD(P)-dependent dehydrogenase (short-subunit alcohol dehydrogenase family)
MLVNFSNNLKIVIVGATGAIGNAMLNLLHENDKVDKIFAISRSVLGFNSPKVTQIRCDFTDEETLKNLDEHIDCDIDIVIVATGVLHEADLQPEKNIKELSYQNMERIFKINIFAPTIIAKYLLPKLAKDKKTVFAVLSARVGSISDNQLGGWYSYRASKAALNMMLKNFAIEMSRTNKQRIVIGLHPGTVQSKLSAPFSHYVKPEKLFTPEFAANSLLTVIDQVESKDSGKIFAYDGEIIAY